jgi:hypothetical protein
MDDSGSTPHAITVVRLSFQSSAQETVGKSSQWFRVLNGIKTLPGWRYTAKGEEVGDSAKVVLIIGWRDNAAPPVAFRPNDQVPEELSPIQPQLTQRPYLFTLWHAHGGATPNLLTTAYRGRLQNSIREVMRISGPTSIVEPRVLEIYKTLVRFWKDREEGRSGHEIYQDKFDGVLYARLDEDAPKAENHCMLALVLNWSSPQGRTDFCDPGFADPNLDRWLQETYGLDFWDKTVAKPLKKLVEQGATVSSWDYHNALMAQDKKGKNMLATSEALW